MEKLTKDEQQLLHSFRLLEEREQIKIIARAEERVLQTILRNLPEENEKQILALTRMLSKEEQKIILNSTLKKVIHMYLDLVVLILVCLFQILKVIMVL